MSATESQIDFVGKAHDLIRALEHARENLDAAVRLAREIETAAKSDDGRGLPRLAFARGRGGIVRGLLEDGIALEALPFGDWIGDACSLHSLIELALGRAVEAMAS